MLKKVPLLFDIRRLKSAKALFFKSEKYSTQETFDKFLQRLNYMTCGSEGEWEYIKRHIKIKAQLLQFITFGTLNDFIPESLQGEFVSGHNILMGNSATSTNNHLDFFEQYKYLKLGDKKLICPLSYGEDWYKNAIIEEGEKLFGEKFHPLTEYLTLSEYNKILLSCSVMVSNHIRSQGMGNIVSGLYLGMKVFLNEENILYSFFRERGFIIFSLQNDFNPSSTDTLAQLPEHDRQINRHKIIQIWNEQAVLNRIRNIVKCIEECNE